MSEPETLTLTRAEVAALVDEAGAESQDAATHSNKEAISITEPAAVKENDKELSPEELKDLEIQRLKDELAALKKDRAECVDLAEEHAAKLRDHEDLKSRAAAAKKEADVLADALSKKVRGEVQVELGDDEEGEQASITFSGATTAAPATPPFGDGGPSTSDTIATRLAAGDVMTIGGLDWSQVSQAALSALVSTGKPATVRPLVLSSGPYVLTDVVDRRAVLHPLLDAETFVNRYRIEGLKLPNDERPAELVALGSHAGIPVKVKTGEKGKRAKVAHIGSDADAVILDIPPGEAISATPPAEEPGDDQAIPGPGSDLVANRIFAHLVHVNGAHTTVESLAKLLGIDEEVVRNAVKSDTRMVYERTDDDELVTRA